MISHDRVWAVRVLGSTLHRTLSSSDAERVARDYLISHGGGELVVHGTDGSLRRSRVDATEGG